MKRFDYKMMTISSAHLRKESFRTDLADNFTQLGSNGWELIKMEPILDNSYFWHGSHTKEIFCVFKKELE